MLNHEQWLKERRKGIGGSDAAAVLGLNKWATPLDVYLSKVEGLKVEENEPMKWGNLLEPVIRQEYAERTGQAVEYGLPMLKHPKHEFILANLDGKIVDKEIGFEAKTARTSEGWGEEGTDEIPENYLIQVQHYMAVTGFKAFDVAVLIGGSDFRIYEVPADKELQEQIIEEEILFWNNHIIPAIPPAPRTIEDAKKMFKIPSIGKTIEADEEAISALSSIKTIKENIKNLEGELDEHTAKVMLKMADAEILEHKGKTLATWKQAKGRESLDTTRFKEKYPILYKEYLKTGEPSRRFLIK